MSQSNIAGKTSASDSRSSLSNAALESSQTHAKNAEHLGASGHHLPGTTGQSLNNNTTLNDGTPGSGATGTSHDIASSPGNINTHSSNSDGPGAVGSINELGQSSFATQRERKAAQRRIIAEDPEWNLAPVEKLTELCLKIIVANFEKSPCLNRIPVKYRDRVLNSISTDLPLSISAPLIPDDAYWKKCATRKFLNCDPSRHGGSWKRLFFENYVQNLVESYVPNSRSLEPASGTASLPSSMQQQQHQKSSNPLASSASNSKTAPTSTIAVAATNAALGKGPDQFTDTNKLMEELKLSAPFVKAIEIIQMRPKEPAEGTIVKSTDPPADHIGADILFGTLVNLEDACFYYGVKDCGMNFEWKLFGMTMNDCISLSNSMKMKTVAKTLRTIKIQSSGIDDDRARLIAAALVDNEVLYKLDLSHNIIGCKGARGFAKVLASKKTSLNHLILANNKIGKEGGHSLVRALASARLLVGPAAASTQRNKSGRSGAPPISHGEEKRICGDNTSLQTLNIRMNRIGDEGGAEFFKILSKNETLKFIDLAANGLGRESVNSLCVLIRKNLKNLRGIDVSCNKLGSSSNNSNGAVVNATASNSSDATPAANQSPVLTTNQSAIDAANSAINNSAEKQPRVGSARDGDPGHAVEPDESGKLLFEAITHNKFITMFDLRVTNIPKEYLTAIQGIVIE